MMRRLIFTSVAVALVTGSALSLSSRGAGPMSPVSPKPVVQPLKKIELNLDKAIAIPIPKDKVTLKATIFKTPDNKEGWAIRIPGKRPIATPTYYNGMIYVGGGYGSHEFYAFDAISGALVWQYRTADDGPTAAVVEDGFVAFNTESCTVYVLDAKTGKLAWQEWLGDPLMSQPAIYKGKLYIAYPAGQRGHHAPFLNKVNANNAGSAGSHNQKIAIKDDPNKRHRMLCADLKTGKHLWEQPITADVISAPVIHDNKVFFTCQDGTSFCMAADSGTKVWEKAHAGTSAPVIADGRVLVTEKEQRDNNLFEGIQIVDSRDGKRAEKAPIWQRSAPYLNNLSGAANGTIAPEAAMSLDSAVGFGGGAPAAAAMDKAASNLNINTVAAGWAYQGPRLALKGSTAFNAQGQTIQSFSLARGGDEWVESSPSRALPQLNWEAQVKGKNVRSDIQVFSPPSLGRKNMYLASQSGHLVALDQKTGELSFSYATGSPVVMQPSLAGGNVYVGTSDGMLICLKTGNPDADGWTAWGGNAQHNKQD